MTSVLVKALMNQPEAFASDLGDDQSRYLFIQLLLKWYVQLSAWLMPWLCVT